MTRTERKLLVVNGVLGTVLTLLVLVLDQVGQLQALERWFYDRRALLCQFFAKPTTDRLVYLDIDDNALETIERWPWKRSTMATVLKEVAAAKPDLVFLDILYSEPQEASNSLQPDGTLVTTDHDALLAETLERAGNVIVPLALDFAAGNKEQSAAGKAMQEILLTDLELTPSEVAERLKARGIAVPKGGDDFIIARRAAMYERISREAAMNPEITLAELRQRLLPKSDPRQVVSPLLRLLAAQHEKFEKLRPFQRFSRPPRPGEPSLLSADDETAPLVIFSRPAGGSGFVNYIEDEDGVVRRIPLFTKHRGRVLPQMGLAIACKLLGADPLSVEAYEDKVVIPCPNGKRIEAPVQTVTRTRGDDQIGTLLNIPYIGGRDWQMMFDQAKKVGKHHVPVNVVWQVTQTRQAIEINNLTADRAIFNVTLLLRGEDEAKALSSRKLAREDAESRASDIRKLLELLDENIKQFKGELTTAEKEDLENLKHEQSGMRAVLVETERLSAQLIRQRAELKELFANRAVLVGSIATGGAYDMKPTSLHGACPGIVIHGVVANGILTGELWKTAPIWITRLLTVLMGLATTVLVIRTTPTQAAIASLSLAIGYLLINGIVIFDRYNTIVGIAGPVVAMLVTWLSCQLVEILVERAERNRITKRFRSYVDPALVNYVIDHPEQDVMGGQEREMTVVFTDLAGFTTISETLKEKVVPLLNDYLGLMTRVIRKHGGYVNKFLGDGIMFFFNAPGENPNHAIDAAATVLDMQEALIEFNRDLVKRGLPFITMRAGITTGPMIAGDAGGTDHSDYTVLGDNVNLAARLESANKATGTKVLMTARTAEMCGNRFIMRPVARLQVKGKTEGITTCELLAPSEQATPQQRRLAELSQAVFDAFVKSDFAGCLAAIEVLEKEFGASKLTELYREEAEGYLKNPPQNGFDGQIVLHEK